MGFLYRSFENSGGLFLRAQPLLLQYREEQSKRPPLLGCRAEGGVAAAGPGPQSVGGRASAGVASLCPPLTLGSAHPEPKVPERSEALTVLHAGSGWGPRDSTGLEYGALLENRS